MLNITDDYDYKEAFEVAMRDSISKVQGSDCSEEPFTVDDVSYTLAFAEGENDGPSWLWIGKLKDGRWAFVDAGCDYTGWG